MGQKTYFKTGRLELPLNTEQAMYIYATRQREMQNETQEARHLQQGGIIMEDRVTVKDGKVIKKQKVQQQGIQNNGR